MILQSASLGPASQSSTWRNRRRAAELELATLVELTLELHVATDRRRWVAHGAHLSKLPMDHLWRVVGRWPAHGQVERLVDLVSVDDPQIGAMGVPWYAVTPASGHGLIKVAP